MWLMIVLLFWSGTLAYAARCLRDHGVIAAYQTCGSAWGMCEQPHLILASVFVIAVFAHIATRQGPQDETDDEAHQVTSNS
jgi:hypothetical protein